MTVEEIRIIIDILYQNSFNGKLYDDINKLEDFINQQQETIDRLTKENIEVGNMVDIYRKRLYKTKNNTWLD